MWDKIGSIELTLPPNSSMAGLIQLTFVGIWNASSGTTQEEWSCDQASGAQGNRFSVVNASPPGFALVTDSSNFIPYTNSASILQQVNVRNLQVTLKVDLGKLILSAPAR